MSCFILFPGGAECAAVDAANDARHSLLQTATADHVHRQLAEGKCVELVDTDII